MCRAEVKTPRHANPGSTIVDNAVLNIALYCDLPAVVLYCIL